MKKLTLCIAWMLFAHVMAAQDMILKKNGDELKAKVMEISENSVKYKKWENLNGPIYNLEKAEIFKVKYENGLSDFYGEVSPSSVSESKPTSQSSLKQEYKVPTTPVKRSLQSDLFNPSSTKIAWMGIDFTHVQLTGVIRSDELNKLKQVYFSSWNEFIPNESDKYDVKGMLRKREMVYDMDMIARLNANANTDKMLNYNVTNYQESDIKKFVAEYDLSGKTGIGILLIAESMNKEKETGCFHFVALDLSTGEILIQDKVCGKPSGYGMKAFWGNSIHDVIKEIKNKKYKTWKLNYELGRSQLTDPGKPHPHDPLGEAIYRTTQKNKARH